MRTEAGSEPYGFPVACLLRGATTILGGIAPIPDVETARILGDVIDSLPSDADVSRILRNAQEAEAERTPPADTYPAQIAGLVAWTLAPANRPAALSKISLHWNMAGLAPEEGRSPSGTYAPDTRLGDLAARTLTYSRYLAKERPAGTLEYLTAAIGIDNADWTGFLVACELGPPRVPANADESAAGTVTVQADGGPVTITEALSKALRLGQLAADHLKDEVMLPRHVVLAALCDADSAASRWIASHRSEASLDWHRHLGDRVFRAALPEPGRILGLKEPRPEVTAPRHQSKIAGATLKKKDRREVRRSPKWVGPLVVAALIVLITASQGNTNQSNSAEGNAAPAQATAHPSSAVGIVFAAASSRGAMIATVLPASPAARARLMTGDILTAVDGSPVTSLGTAKDALDYGQPGTSISLTVLRGTQRLTVRAILGQPLKPTDPGYIGVELRNQPINGVLVVTVAPDGPAALAGLRPGDMITSVSGQPDGGSALGATLLIQSRHPGQLVQLLVIRGHRRITVNVVARQQPDL
jgi:hypothetical protein